MLDDFPVCFETPVAWGEMDAFAHVNNIVFFRYFESARIAYFRRVGFLEHMEQTGVGPILARTSCVFRHALTYPDTVRVGARADDVGEDRFTMHYRIVSTAQDRTVAEGEGRIVCYDYRAGAKAPLPDAVRAAIREIEARTT